METKLVNSLPTSKFYRLEHDSNGRCILLYIGHEIPLRLQRVYKINNNPGFCSIEVDTLNSHERNVSDNLHYLNNGLDV